MYEEQQVGYAGAVAARANASARGAFIARTYLHVLGAVLGFIMIESALVATGLAVLIAQYVFMGGNLGWALVLGAFMGASWLANRWAQSDTSPMLQYAGLSFYVACEALIFAPLIAIVTLNPIYDGILLPAAITTLVIFGCLTGIVFVTRKDFSFLRSALMFGSIAAMCVIGAALLFDFHLGILFSGAMCVLMGGYILFQTSNVMLHYRTDQHVAAALALFASLATLFWYVLRIFMSRRD